MAETGSGGGNGGGNSEGQPRVSGDEAERPRIDDQVSGEPSSSGGAVVASSSDGDGGHATEVVDGDGRRTPGSAGRTPAVVGPVGPRVSRLDFQSGVEGLVVTGLGSGEVGGSGGDVGSGDDRPEAPRRDPAKGKDLAAEEDAPIGGPTGPAEFRPATGSSAHVPITRGDFAEFVTEEVLDRLWRENPVVVEAVMSAREERLRQVAQAQEEERLRVEAERAKAAEDAFVQETEVVEQAQEEGGLARERAVARAEAMRAAGRPAFEAGAYVPPEPHLFIPSGFESYIPRRDEYDAELVLRDPEWHLSVDWAQVFL